MKILVVDALQYAQVAADAVVEHILYTHVPEVIGFATGTTTPPVYELLARRAADDRAVKKKIDALSVFNVDEYLGVASDNPGTCLSRMKDQLYRHIDPKKVICFRSDASDPEKDSLRVMEEIDMAGGLGLQILGIGGDGHIGFNDPDMPWELETAVVSFSDSSRVGKAGFWGGVENVPKQGVTLGVKGIMNARSLMLLARGESKAEIVCAALEGPVTTGVPASVLQLHPFVTVVLDRAAAAGLKRRNS